MYITALIILLLWLMVGHLTLALTRWGYPHEFHWWEVWTWPTGAWIRLCLLIHDWRQGLYERTKDL